MSRRAAWGAAAVAAYLVAAALTFRSGILPVRPLYEGAAPPAPYRWVSPPPDFAPFNMPPEPGEGAIELTPEGSRGATIPTFEAPPQASLIVDPEDIAPREGEDEVAAILTPLDPATVGPPPPGHTYAGNAYRIEVRYAASREPADVAQSLTITMRYAVHATDLWRRGGEGTGWERIEAAASLGSLELFADVEQVGIFVTTAAAPGGRSGDLVAAAGGVAVTVGGILLARRRQLRKAAAASRQVRRARERKRRR